MSCEYTESLDASWQLCPVPILMTEERIKEMKKGAVLRVVFTDPGAVPDLEAWCAAAGHRILGFENEKPRSFAYIRKG
ncbi:MAG: sulfurtransferase TusA family protein [Candidatus Omnitrophica bacterium]|nr:sulfurtransferase TusA family protein [Candidatus Omnitrophota bacterium]